MYSVIYADPPWFQPRGRKIGKYKVVGESQVWAGVGTRSERLPYPTMSVDEIAALPVKDISERDSYLFMWVTNRYLLESAKVVNAWGFKYVACITWKKARMGGGLGGVVRVTSEHLLFCRRGNLRAVGVVPESVIEAKRPYVGGYPCHSKKPLCFIEMIERVSPPGRRLEMFARSRRDGWDVFGNQVDGSVVMPY